MAILPSYLPLLDACHRRQGIVSSVLALGSQQFPDPPAFLSAWATEGSYATMTADPSWRPSSATATASPSTAASTSTTTPTSASTSRHRCQRSCAAPWAPSSTAAPSSTSPTYALCSNIHLLLRPGGTLIGFLPVANGWETLAEGFWFRVSLPIVGTRFFTVITREGDVRPRAKLWNDRLLNRLFPGRTICCCYRKVGDQPFVVPIDMFGYW